MNYQRQAFVDAITKFADQVSTIPSGPVLRDTDASGARVVSDLNLAPALHVSVGSMRRALKRLQTNRVLQPDDVFALPGRTGRWLRVENLMAVLYELSPKSRKAMALMVELNDLAFEMPGFRQRMVLALGIRASLVKPTPASVSLRPSERSYLRLVRPEPESSE